MLKKQRKNMRLQLSVRREELPSPRSQSRRKTKKQEEVESSPATQEPEEDTHLDAQEVLADTQEIDQDTLGEGLTSLLAAYTDEEELAASTEPQELVEIPTQEQAPTQGNKDEKEEASALSPKKIEALLQHNLPRFRSHKWKSQNTLAVQRTRGNWTFSLTQ
jgi:hypothetical protein